MIVKLLDMKDFITGSGLELCYRLCVTVYTSSTHTAMEGYDKCLSFFFNGISQTVILLNVSDSNA